MIFRPSGGLTYHLRAFARRGRWAPFRRAVETTLANWKPPTARLVLIGPSGGYTLTDSFLKRFQTIDAYDLDPLAPLFFRLSHPGIPVRFHRRNVFARDRRLDVHAIDGILRAHPDAAILFSNVIGQILLETRATEDQWRMFLRALRARLANRHWASYHDRFTDEGGVRIDHLTGGDWLKGLATTPLEWAFSARSLRHVEAVRHVASRSV